MAGGGEEGTTSGEGTTTTGGEDTSAAGGAVGESIFTSSCGGCHTLAAAGTSGAVGPNLDQLTDDKDRIVEQVTNGGGGMPAFGGRLTDDEIDAVAQYVVDSRDPNASDDGGGSGP